jgi:hypothetical protein
MTTPAHAGRRYERAPAFRSLQAYGRARRGRGSAAEVGALEGDDHPAAPKLLCNSLGEAGERAKVLAIAEPVKRRPDRARPR